MSWELKRLADVAQVVRGVTYQKPALLSQGHPDGIPLLRATNVQDRYVDYEEPVTVPRSLVKDNQFLQSGDILIASSSGSESVVGKSAKVVESTPATFGAFCTLLRATAIDPDFLAYFVSSTALRQRWRASARGSNINNLRASEIAQSEVPVPPLDEQKRIVAQLEDQLGRITTVEELMPEIDNAVAIQQTSLLHKVFRDLETEGSLQVRVGQIASIKTGKVDVNSGNPDGEFPFFTCAREVHRTDVAPYEGKVVLVAGNGDLNVKYHEGRFNAYQRTYFLHARDERQLIPRFLFWFLESHVEKLRQGSIGTTIKYIKLGDLRDAVVPLPTLETQGSVVGILDEILEHFETFISDITRVRKSLEELRSKVLDQAFREGRDS